MRAYLAVAVLACSLGAHAATNVFEMPLVYQQHLQLQQQLVQCVRAGKTAEMERVSREGVAIMPLDPTWRYNLACALAYRADKREAFEALERAVELGFRDTDTIAADNDLAPMRGDPRFAALLEKAKRLGQAPAPGVVAVRPATVVMGLPAEVNAGNTVWDFEQGCFRTLLELLAPELKRVSAYADAYRGPAADRVRGWMKEESAAGNFGDLYVNRDDGHSALAVTNFPGLTPVVYSADAKRHHVNVTLPNALFGPPVIGNCSMSMVSGPFWRSLPRAVVTDPVQPVAAFRYYMNNQCWIYPEHKDYDPEMGDLYPANTPYYVVCQGSSYADQPFVQAFAAALAAFQPATKRALIERQMVGPTLQMLLRATQKGLKKPEEYLTGAAHPVVFDAGRLDPEAMVERAHAMKPEQVPPLVALRTVSDAQAELGLDFFDIRPEGLFDTPCCIARVVRGLARERTMTVEATCTSTRPDLKFQWVVLQGDPKKVTIKPLDARASRVALTVAYHGRFRLQDEVGAPQPMQSGRVDIGCFVKEGESYSPPSFVCFYYLSNEVRAYRDDGRILSVDYTNAERRYADPALTLEKGWKDLYAYDPQGRLTGWYRTRAGGTPERFTYKGHKVLSTDSRDRPLKACAVQYLPRQSGEGLPAVLTCAELPQAFSYRYADDKDLIGQVSEAR